MPGVRYASQTQYAPTWLHFGGSNEESHRYRRNLLQRERPCRTASLVQAAPRNRRPRMGRHGVHVGRRIGQSDKGTIVWSIGAADDEYFAPSKATFMINYRVEDLAAVLQSLRSSSDARCARKKKPDPAQRDRSRGARYLLLVGQVQKVLAQILLGQFVGAAMIMFCQLAHSGRIALLSSCRKPPQLHILNHPLT